MGERRGRGGKGRGGKGEEEGREGKGRGRRGRGEEQDVYPLQCVTRTTPFYKGICFIVCVWCYEG